MASKPLEFHQEAEQEYLAALAWYKQRSPSAAVSFEAAFERAVRTIKKAPQRWPIYFAGCRRYTLHQFPFMIVYSTLGPSTFVLAVAHGHRRPGYWSDRL